MDLDREIAQTIAETIRLRLKISRTERIFSTAVPISFTLAGIAFLIRGMYGFAALMVYAAFMFRFVLPRAERAGRRAGWSMAWSTAVAIVRDADVDEELINQLKMASLMTPSEDNELAQARLTLLQLQEFLGEGDDHEAQ